MTPGQADAARTLAKIVSRNYQTFPLPDRISALECIAALLSNAESVAASQAAFMLRKAEEHQLKFHDLLANSNPNS